MSRSFGLVFGVGQGGHCGVEDVLALRSGAPGNPRADYLRALREHRGTGGYGFSGFDRTRSIFVHIPKTAGVSIARALYDGLGAGHLGIHDYEMALRPVVVSGYFMFTLVRNPWDRLYSAYTFLMSGGMNDHDRAWAERHLAGYRDFEEFVVSGLETVKGQIHFVPQVEFLKSAIRPRTGVNFIGLYENIADDFAAVSAVVNPAAQLRHENRTVRAPGSYRDAYSRAMIEAVGRSYRVDVDAFGYVFDGSSLDAQLSRRRPTARSDALQSS
jgi:hypothetical protein